MRQGIGVGIAACMCPESSSGEGETARRRTWWAEFSLSDENLCESSKRR